MDLIFLVFIVVFFIASFAFLVVCDHLMES